MKYSIECLPAVLTLQSGQITISADFGQLKSALQFPQFMVDVLYHSIRSFLKIWQNAKSTASNRNLGDWAYATGA